MYNSLSDLNKMFCTPEFILFSVEINGKQFLGRPIQITLDDFWVPSQDQRGVFRTASSVQSFLAGYVGEDIPVTSATIKGIEAIDTVDPGPLKRILSACNDLSNITSLPNVGIIWRNIPPILDKLTSALEDYEALHEQTRYDTVYDNMFDIREECVKCPANLPDNGRASIVRNMKDKISSDVTRLIEMGSYVQLT